MRKRGGNIIERNPLFLVLRHESIERGASLVLLLVELVNDDANKEVEGEECPKHNESNKVYVLVQVVLVAGLLIELGKDLLKEDNKALKRPPCSVNQQHRP